jgi:hypothetical protein
MPYIRIIETGERHMNKIDVELYIAMNEDGGWIVTNDESDTIGTLAENEGGNLARVVKVTVKMTPPTLDEATVDIPDSAGSVEATAGE